MAVRCYLIPGQGVPSYAMLLSRRWLRQGRVQENYETDTYVIKDMYGVEYQVHAIPPVNKNVISYPVKIPKIVINPESSMVELNEETVEELSMGEDLIAAIVRESSKSLRRQNMKETLSQEK